MSAPSAKVDDSGEYDYTELDDSGRAAMVDAWEPHMTPERVAVLESEIWLERPVYGVARRSTGEIVAFFDVQKARDQNKNLQVFFSPQMVGDGGLTSVDLDRISGLLVFIFVSMMRQTDSEGMSKLKIHSHDKVLLGAFAGFAQALEHLGYCSVKIYGGWIDVSDLQMRVKSVA